MLTLGIENYGGSKQNTPGSLFTSHILISTPCADKTSVTPDLSGWLATELGDGK